MSESFADRMERQSDDAAEQKWGVRPNGTEPMTDLDDLARLAEVAKAEAMPAEGVYTNTGLAALRMFQQFATPEVVAELVERVKRAEAEVAFLKENRLPGLEADAAALDRAEAVIAEAKLQIECDEPGDAWRILSGYEP